MRNPRALFNFYIYASNKLNDIFKFNMTKNDIIEQVYAYVRYGDLCNSYYVDNEWPVKFEDVEYELNRSNIDYETEANIENINNFEYFSVPDSRDFHREIRDEIVEYEANEVDICGDVDAEINEYLVADSVVMPVDDLLVIYANQVCDDEEYDKDDNRDEFTSPYQLREMCKSYLKKSLLVSHDSLADFAKHFDSNHVKLINGIYEDEQDEIIKAKEQEALNAENE